MLWAAGAIPWIAMTVTEFVAKWRKVELKERSAAQEHFLDLCKVFEHPTPAAADPTGESYCFERGAVKHGGGEGFADVWKRGFWGWEYKGKHKDLDDAYDQLLRYRDALENPPLLLVCDLDRIVVHTNFTGTVSATHEIPLEALSDPRNIETMRAVFHDPFALRPGRTSTAVTQDAARQFAEIAAAMRKRGLDPAAVAHFLDRIVFCLFAEDAGLMPSMVFTRIVENSAGDPDRFGKLLGQLFETMATGGDFGLEAIRHFNGNLFDDRTVLPLTAEDVKRIGSAAALNWSAVDPSIFGTLFERGLDPNTRAKLGAHFTSREDIELIVDAVVMAPLRREWDATKETIESLLATGRRTPGKAPAKPLGAAAMRKAKSEADSILHEFLIRLRSVKILDPACGSGNFLYVALLRLKDLEKEAAVIFPSEHGMDSYLPGVSPSQLYGIEINAYAHDLAQMTVWIGWLQWIRANGFGFPADPILKPLTDNIRRMDAILAPDGSEPDWPKVDYIIGNPPFLGGKFMRRELSGAYVDRLFELWRDRVRPEADLCCYWFEKARAHIAAGQCRRTGLLATQGIRGGANREVLKRIKAGGGLFWAESDRPWVLDGANVHVSMIGFDDGTEATRTLDGKPVSTINANLTAAADTTQAEPLAANRNACFMGTTKGGPFDVSQEQALSWLRLPNPHGRPSSDVVVPWVNGMDLNQRPSNTWIVDFGSMEEREAAKYEAVFAYVRDNVKPRRDGNNRAFIPLGVRHANAGSHGHGRMRHGDVFNIDGADPFATRLDHVLAAVSDLHEAIGVNGGHVARGEPAPALGIFDQRALSLVIGSENPRSAHQQVAIGLAVPGQFVAIAVHDFHVHAEDGPPLLLADLHLLVLGQVELLVLERAQSAQRAHFSHAPGVQHLDTKIVLEGGDHGRWAGRAANHGALER